MVIAYLTRIKKIPEKQLKEMSFYRYDKIRMKYYIEFDNFDKKQAIIGNYQCADLEEFEEGEKVLNGFRTIAELFDGAKESNPDIKNIKEEEKRLKEEIINNKNKNISTI
mgnify:FL=1